MAFFDLVNGGVKQNGHYSSDRSYRCPNMCHCHPSSQPTPAAKPARETQLSFPNAPIISFTGIKHSPTTTYKSDKCSSWKRVICIININITSHSIILRSQSTLHMELNHTESMLDPCPHSHMESLHHYQESSHPTGYTAIELNNHNITVKNSCSVAFRRHRLHAAAIYIA